MSEASEESGSPAEAGSSTPDSPRTGGADGDSRFATSPLLERLSSDIGDVVIVERFVNDYLSLLDGRLETLRDLLGQADADATRLAILSLESSSAMLGASEMVAAARELRHAVMVAEAELAHRLFTALLGCGEQLRKQLAEQGFVSPPTAESPGDIPRHVPSR